MSSKTIAALQQHVAYLEGTRPLETVKYQMHAEILSKALKDLLDDLKERAKWMHFEPQENGTVLPCGNGVYTAAEQALAATNFPEWRNFNTAPKDGTEVILWVSSEKGFPDQTSNFFFMPDTELNRKVYGDKVGCWYWSESEEPLKRPDLVKGWKLYPQPPEGE